MAAYIHAKESAIRAQQPLHYVQACDHILNSLPGNKQPQDFYKEFLEEPNVNNTKRLPAFRYLHIGLEHRVALDHSIIVSPDVNCNMAKTEQTQRQ